MSFINLQLRRANAATWAGLNLASGEIGLETDTSKFKINYSATTQPWSAVSYVSSGSGGGGTIDIGGPYGQHLYTGQTAPDITGFPNAVVNDIYLKTDTNDAYVTQRNNYTTPTPTSLYNATGSLITSIIKVGAYLYAVDQGRNNIVQYDITAQTSSVFAGASDGSAGYINDTGTAARFQGPTSIVYDGTANFYVSDTGNNCIRAINATTAAVTLLVGLAAQLTPDPSDDPTAPFNVAALSDYGIQNLPPFSNDSETDSFLGDVSAPKYMVWANSKIYFTEQNNTKIRTCSPADIVVITGRPPTAPPRIDFDGTYSSPRLSTILASVEVGSKTPTSLGQLTFDGTSTIYVAGGIDVFSINIGSITLNVVYTLPATANSNTLYYFGWHYKSGVLYYTVADETTPTMYIYALNIQSVPKLSLVREFSAFDAIRAIFVDTDSLNTIYVNIESDLYKIPAGLAFTLIPEQTQSPQTENFVVAGGSGTTKLSYSYDGLRWLASPTPSVISYRVLSIAFNGSIWVAGGDNDGDANMTTLVYSSDGINWTASASGSSLITGMVKAVVWTGSVWVAGGNGTNTLAYSYDGVNWLAQPTQLGTAVYSLYWTGSVLLAGNNGNGLAYSYDGIIFKSADATADFFDISSPSWPLCYAQSSTLIVAGCHDSIAMSWSYDGFSWNTSTSGTALFSYVNGLAYNGSLWVAAGDGTNYLAYSLDGKAWTASASGNTLLATSTPARTVIWNGSIWIASAGSGANKKSVYSYDGINWAPLESANSLSTNNVLALSNRVVRETNYKNTLQTENFMVAGGNGGAEGNNRLVFSYDGINWNSSPSGKALFPGPSSTDDCSALEWNGSLWVAGGAGTTNRLGYSTDGKTWFASASGNSAIPYVCNCLKWNGELWVAAGGDNTNFNTIAYSYDGINWAALANPSNMVMISYALEYNGSMWLIGGDGDGVSPISYSYDGISWFPVAGLDTIMYTVRAIKWNGTMFVAGGNGSGAISVNTLMYSYDGINWTASPSSNTIIPTQTNAVAWNGKTWVCGGTGTSGTDTMAYSNDGITWTAGNTYTLAYDIRSIAWNGSIWIAGSGVDVVSNIIYSYDGIDWFQAKTGYSPFDFQCLALRARKVDNYKTPTPVQTENFMVAGGLGTDGSTLAYTYDGLNWLSSPSGNTILDDSVRSLAWNGSLWVAGGTGTNFSLAYSADGINWNGVSGSNTLTTQVNCIKWNGSILVAGGPSGIIYSYDGLIWHLSTSSPVTALEWNGIMWLGGGGGSLLFYSYDGIVWKEPQLQPNIYGVNSIVWNGKMWVVGGNYSAGTTTLAYSYDGFVWNNSDSGETVISNTVNGVSWNGVLWVAVGLGTNVIASSEDGITWTASTPANPIYTSGVVINVSWNGKLWIAAGISPDQGLAYSYDGYNWYKSESANRTLGKETLCVQARKVNLPPKIDTTITENFMVAGAIQTASPAPQKLLYYSYDGLTWQASPSTIFDYADTCLVKKIEYNGSQWIAIGINFTVGMVLYSEDGINWALSSSANDLLSAAAAAPTSLKWFNNMWLIGTDDTSISLLYSYDGITWVANPTPVFADEWGVGTIETDGTVIVAGRRGAFGYSYDGLAWSYLTVPFPTPAGDSIIVWNGKTWVAGFTVDGTLYHSKDGLSWTLSTDTAPYTGIAAFAGGQVLAITYNKSTWVAAGQLTNGAACLISSNDGINWSTPETFPTTDAGQIRTVEWNGSFFSAYGVTIAAPIKTYGVKSYDGTNWVPINGSKAVISTLKSRRLTEPPPIIKPLTENFMVAGGGAGSRIAYTYDGLNWISSPSGSAALSGQCNAITWNGSLWVAGGGTTNSLAYSVDGINWTPVTGSAALTTQVVCVKWNGSIWLAGCLNTNFILYSYDGISWEPALSAAEISTSTWDLAWDGNMWLAAITGMAKIMYSYDGIDWQPVLNGPLFDTATYTVAWNGSIWVAGGNSTATQSTLSYSYDGVIWTDSDSTAIDTLVNKVSWNGSQWLALGEGTEVVARSSDGTTWAASPSAKALYTTGRVFDAKWNGKFWVAVGNGTNSFAYSYNGNNWFKIESGNSCLDSSGYGIGSRIVNLPPKTIKTPSENFMVAGSTLLTVGEPQTLLYYTYDGLTWHGSQSSSNLFTISGAAGVYGIEYNGSIWVAAARSNATGIIIYSHDGINWASSASASSLSSAVLAGTGNDATYFTAVKWAKNIWVASNNFEDLPIIYSYDGINWTASSTATAIFTAGVSQIATNGNLTIGYGGSVFAYSNDGIIWLAGSDPFSGEPITNISWNGRIWVVGVYGSRIHYSTDGISWNQAPATGAYAAAGGFDGVDAISIAFNNSVWVAVGSHTATEGRLMYSYDGINWLSNSMTWNLGTVSSANIVEWNGEFFSIYGDTGDTPAYFGAKSYDGKNWYPINISPTTFITKLKSRKLSPGFNKSMDDLVFLNLAEDAPVVIDCNASTKFWITPDGTNALSFTNLPAVNTRVTTIEITVYGTGSITWPSVYWTSLPPTSSVEPSGGTYIVQLRYNPAACPAGTAGVWLGSIIWAD